jgi:peptide/nickel transport system permease protein
MRLTLGLDNARAARWLLAVVALALAAALVSSALQDPYLQRVDRQFLSPGPDHWLGTDHLGRDVLSRAWFALGNTLQLISACLAVTLLLAFPLGMAAARSRPVESAVEVLAGAIYSLPTFIIGLVVFIGVKGQWILFKFALLGLFNWVPVYRAVRDNTKQVQALPYVTFARAMGFPEREVYRLNVLPNILPPVVPVAMLNLVSLLEAEFLLSFIGLSYPDPVPTLGGLLRQGIAYLNLPMMMVPTTLIGVLIFALVARFEQSARARA